MMSGFLYHFSTYIIRLTEALPGSGANARLPRGIETSPSSHSTNFRLIALPSLLV
jgi:hypothetical protein